MAERVPARLTPAEGRRFGLTVGLAFLVLAGIAGWRGRVYPTLAFGVAGSLLTLAGLVIPTYLGPVSRGWSGFAHALSKITTPVFVGVVFYVVLTPVAVLMRLFRARPLPRPAPESSGWIPRPPESRRRLDMQRQF